MSDAYLPSGEVNEETRFVPMTAARYSGRVVNAEIVDPETLGWNNDSTTGKPVPPFLRLRWQVTGDGSGQPCIYDGRYVDQRVDLSGGTNPKTGRSRLEALAGVIRLANGLGKNDDVRGMRLYEVDGFGTKAEQLIEASRQLQKLVGLQAVIRVGTSGKDENEKDAVFAIVL